MTITFAVPLEATTIHQHSTTIVCLRGHLSGTASDATALDIAYTEARRLADDALLLDFTEVTHIAGSGLALLADLLDWARGERRRLLACGLAERDADRLWIAGLASGIGLFPDQSSALADELAYRREVLRGAWRYDSRADVA